MLLRAAGAPAGEGGPISGRRLPLLDPLAPAQTMPAPTREAKAEAARQAERREREEAARRPTPAYVAAPTSCGVEGLVLGRLGIEAASTADR